MHAVEFTARSNKVWGGVGGIAGTDKLFIWACPENSYEQGRFVHKSSVCGRILRPLYFFLPVFVTLFSPCLS